MYSDIIPVLPICIWRTCKRIIVFFCISYHWQVSSDYNKDVCIFLSTCMRFWTDCRVKQRCRCFGEIFATGCTGSCRFSLAVTSKYDISISVMAVIFHRRPLWRHKMETFFALLALCEGNHQSPMDSLHKGHWRGALMFSLICAWSNVLGNNRHAGGLIRHCAYYDFTVMQ